MVMKPSFRYSFIFGIFTYSEEKVLVIKSCVSRNFIFCTCLIIAIT